jgi:hypothetical protein
VIVQRYEAATGKAAILTETGETFQELAARRATETAQMRVEAPRTEAEVARPSL